MSVSFSPAVRRPFLLASLALNVVLLAGILVLWEREARHPGLRSAEFARLENGDARFILRLGTPVDVTAPALRESPFVFRPAFDYTIIWNNAREAAILPRQRVPPGKEYLVRLRPGLTDSAGTALRTNAVAVQTDPLQFHEPVTPVRVDKMTTRLTFRFNGAVRPATLAHHLAITDAAGQSLEVTPVETQSVLRPAVEVSHSDDCRELRITVKAGLRAEDADYGFPRDLALVIPLTNTLHIAEVEAEGTDEGMVIDFSVPGNLNPEEAKASIRVVPGVEFRVVPHWGGRYRLTGDFRPQSFYRITFLKGLTTLAGQRLAQDEEFSVITGHFEALIRFATEGPYLPRHRSPVLPLRLRNIEELQVKVTRIYPNNLVAFLRGGDYDNGTEFNGRLVGEKELAPGLAEDTAGLVNLSLDGLLGPQPTGIYVVRMVRKDRYYPSASRRVVVTDLGLSATLAPTEAVLQVMSLQTNRPVADCDVQILSVHNQLLGSGRTDPAGLVKIAIPADPEHQESPGLAVARQGDDLSYLVLDGAQERNLTELDLPSRQLPAGPYEAFLYTERGICRPGEDISLNVMVRDAALRGAGGFPCELRISDPLGKLFHKEILPLNPDGFATCLVALPPQARTGRYTVTAGVPGAKPGVAGETWGSCEFKVGAYVPDRIRVELKLDKDDYLAGDTLKADLTGRYYFGKPAGGYRAKFRAACTEAPFAPKAFADFTFGNSERSFSLPDFPGPQEVQTDAAGLAHYTLTLPAQVTPPAALLVTIAGTIEEPGGRAVSGTASAMLYPYPYYLGLKALWKEGRPPRDRLPFAWTAVAPDGKLARPGAALHYELARSLWQYVLTKAENGCYVRKWTHERVPVGKGTVAVAAAQQDGTFEVACPDPGSYSLLITDAAGQIQTQMEFWYWQSDAGVRPSRSSALDLTADRESCHPGETVTVTFAAPTAGQALVCTGITGVQQAFVVAAKAGENRVTVPVPDIPFGSFYVEVSLIRDPAPAGTAEVLPGRLFGLIALDVGQDAHHLVAAVTVPEIARPGQTVPVDITLTNAGKPVAGSVQLLAVDEGILALTGFKTPEPFAFFFGPRACGLRFSDMYDALFPDLDLAAEGKKSADGGDGAGASMLSPVLPDQLKPAIVILPLVAVPESGHARVEMELPPHTGALRVMAVAFNAAAVGNAETQVRLRNEITVQLTAPQAVAPGDEFEITARVFNHDLPAGDAHVTLALTGPFTVSGEAAVTVPLDKGGEASAIFRLRAAPDTAGAGTIHAVLELGNAKHEAVAHLASRPPSPPLYLSGYAEVPAGGSLDLALPGDWFAGTSNTRLEVATVMTVETAGAFHWLRQYPYGCLEQSVSAAFPLLYFPELLPAPGVHFAVPLLYLPAPLAAWTSAWTKRAPGDTSPFVPELRSAVQRVAMMEVAAGGFAMWPGSSRVWNAGTVYTAHFLAEVRGSGGEVDPALWSRTLEFLRQAVSRSRGDLTPGEKAYALYVLACAGKPEHGLAESVAADADAEPFSRFLAAAALVRGGRARVGAERLAAVFKEDYLAGGSDSGLDSRTRRLGLALSILADVMPDSPECVRLVEALRKARNTQGHWGSTQDNAFAVLGLGKWTRLHPDDPTTRGLVLPPADAAQVEVSKAAPAILTGLPGRGKMTVKSLGPGPVYCSWTSAGVPLKPLVGKNARGISVTRAYLAEDGKSAPAAFKQGDLVRVRITLESVDPRQNVAVADLLPGGFEIEDETLASRWAPAAKAAGFGVQFLDKRQDRLLLFGDLEGGKSATFTYTVRAVSRGKFTVPAISAEAMYEPAVRGSFAPAEKIEIR